MKLVFHLVVLVFYLTTISSIGFPKIKANGPYFAELKRNRADDGEDDGNLAFIAPDDDAGDTKTNSVQQKNFNAQLSPSQVSADLKLANNIKKKKEQWQKYRHKDDEINPQTMKFDNHARKPKLSDNKYTMDKFNVASKSKDASKNNFYLVDPVLNAIRSQPVFNSKRNFEASELFRRAAAEETESEAESSSREMKDFKQEFKEIWMHKKFQALNGTLPHGDKVNMLAARPWGKPCGDPNQHDMPWGSCMLTAECEPEFRIYRGDYLCGRTKFICCALQITTYDTYQGFDISFEDKSLSTDSEEKHDTGGNSREKKKKQADKARKKRHHARESRKKKIKRHIKKIIKEITKILNKQYRNGTKTRKKRTKQLKTFIAMLKKQYRKDRQSVKDLHEHDMMHIDKTLMNRLQQIEMMNSNFVSNATFREVLLNGTITKKAARMLLEAYPELNEFLEARRLPEEKTARRYGEDDSVLEYDVEYGYLYY